jgi:hypothetical protein
VALLVTQSCMEAQPNVDHSSSTAINGPSHSTTFPVNHLAHTLLHFVEPRPEKMVLDTRNDGHVPVMYQPRILTAAAKQLNVETRQMDTCSWIFVSPESSGLSYALEEYIHVV